MTVELATDGHVRRMRRAGRASHRRHEAPGARRDRPGPSMAAPTRSTSSARRCPMAPSRAWPSPCWPTSCTNHALPQSPTATAPAVPPSP